jgi:ribosomal protein L37E
MSEEDYFIHHLECESCGFVSKASELLMYLLKTPFLCSACGSANLTNINLREYDVFKHKRRQRQNETGSKLEVT